ncbi:MAG: alcohol dehydrogenase catalytic domain-containing protein [Nitrososphaerota archaeon]|nr:alcohol dehydrogenase catalytic domain-containing protein [Nitrososphaerota archaeon]MDG6975335.1 alcohol dehydrogenase catalytic domain-containing protein [Nitrososphaerota archaeon]MDG6980511.1 alcohol dehydrogenase catalytic domain-containing protein [Nitrososphaerota archaeon]MDG7027035.1 alcohol dehydrogenase catalytic domain-containing protein [Nitrososphaerota archaeon]MDG7030361.1 alcohol dehydrogenase catalytic domain-containing protein [Nitrososphaerota archaeon]
MRAVVYDGTVSCREVSPPRRTGEAVIAVRRAGICGTDLAIKSGKLSVPTPLVLGHEILGTVVSAPSWKPDLVGKRAVTEINVSCGGCAYCRMGLRTHCEKVEALGIRRDGGFAEQVSTPAENIHLVPDSVRDDEAVFIEPLAACVQITKVTQIDHGSTIAVVGVGRMGLLALQVLKLRAPQVMVAIGHKGVKLEMARRLGAHAFDSEEITKVFDLTGGTKFDNVVEVTGTPEGLSLAMDLVRPRGTLHLKSTHGTPVEFDATRVAVDELRVQGSRCGPFEEAIELLRRGDVKVDGMITRRFPLDRCEEAFESAASSSAIKTVFEI